MTERTKSPKKARASDPMNHTQRAKASKASEANNDSAHTGRTPVTRMTPLYDLCVDIDSVVISVQDITKYQKFHTDNLERISVTVYTVGDSDPVTFDGADAVKFLSHPLIRDGQFMEQFKAMQAQDA